MVELVLNSERVKLLLFRDVVGRVVTRCEENKGVGLLLPGLVEVREHRAGFDLYVFYVQDILLTT